MHSPVHKHSDKNTGPAAAFFLLYLPCRVCVLLPILYFIRSIALSTLPQRGKKTQSKHSTACFSASPHQFRNESSSPVAACPFYWIVSLNCSLQDVHLPRRTRSLLRLVRCVETESIKEKHNFVDFHHLSLIFRQFARADR